MAVTPPAPAVVAPVTPTPQPERPQIEPTMPPARQGSAPAAAPRPGDEFRVMPQGEVEVHQVSSRGFGLVCLAVPCVFVLALIGIIIAVVKRSRPTGPQQPFPFNPNQPNPNVPPVSGIQPRATQDGFWVDTTRYNAGDRLRYRYQGPGGMVEDEFVVDPSTQGQFIYTGVTPMNIVLLGLAVAGAAGFLQSQLPPQPPPIPPQPRRTDTGFRNYPSAY